MEKGKIDNIISGNGWLYYKFYMGPKTAEDFLKGTINILTNDLLANKIISHWFFIRYLDPHPHLRIRFRLTNGNQNETALKKVTEMILPWLNSERIWKVQTDKYHRETDRYGQKNMDISEQIFWHDSETIIELIRLIKSDKDEELRWQFGLGLIYKYLNIFDFNDDKKAFFLINLREAYYQQFKVNYFIKSQIDIKYRKYRKLIESVISGNDPAYQDLNNLLERQNINLCSLAEVIIERNRKGNLEIPIDELVSSYIHMSINRLFRTRPRLHELVIYDFAYRYIQSAIAKRKSRLSK